MFTLTHLRQHPGFAGLWLLTSLLLAACNPSDSKGGKNDDNPLLTTLELSFKQTKLIQFDWPAVEGASHYQLQESIDGSAEFNLVDDAIVGTHFELEVPLYTRTQARYLLDACTDQVCNQAFSAAVTAEDVNRMANAIGYFKSLGPVANGLFGNKVVLSADGSTLAVGADQDQQSIDDSGAFDTGVVYVFNRTRAGVWSPQLQRLTSTNPDPSDDAGFGLNALSLSSDGSTLAVGAADSTDATRAGAVYLFDRSKGGDWGQPQRLTAPTPQANERFGSSAVSLSADGRILAVGATGSNNRTGSVYLYSRADLASPWLHNVTLTAGDKAQADSLFGDQVSLSQTGTRLAVGAALEDKGGSFIDTGAVYIFSRPDTASEWGKPIQLTAFNPNQDDNYGYSLSLSPDGDTLAVGVPSENTEASGVFHNPAEVPVNSTADNSGAIYLYKRLGDDWAFQAYLKASNAQTGDRFGEAVSLSETGDYLVVGAYLEDSQDLGLKGSGADNQAAFSGATYLFRRSNGRWQQSAYLKAPNSEANDQFGYSVSLSADGATLAIGANIEESAAEGVNPDGQQNNEVPSTGAGAVYLY